MKSKYHITVGILVLILMFGWFTNIVRFAMCDFDSPWRCEAVRAVGIAIPPVGGVLGYVALGE